MSNPDIIRAWKDAKYRQSLNAEELAAVPAHPAGDVELSEAELASVDGGIQPVPTTTVGVTASMPCHFTLETVRCGNTLLAVGECLPPTAGIGTAPCYTVGEPICPVKG